MENKSISITRLVDLYNDNLNKPYIELGTKMHKYIENYLKDKIEPNITVIEEKRIFDFFLEAMSFFNDFETYKIEEEIEYVYKNILIKGRIDIILKKQINDKDIYYIIDWKISKDLNYIQMKRYIIIMNIYYYILMKKINNPKSYYKLYLILLHHNNESFIVKEIKKLSKEQILYFFEKSLLDSTQSC